MGLFKIIVVEQVKIYLVEKSHQNKSQNILEECYVKKKIWSRTIVKKYVLKNVKMSS